MTIRQWELPEIEQRAEARMVRDGSRQNIGFEDVGPVITQSSCDLYRNGHIRKAVLNSNQAPDEPQRGWRQADREGEIWRRRPDLNRPVFADLARSSAMLFRAGPWSVQLLVSDYMWATA